MVFIRFVVEVVVVVRQTLGGSSQHLPPERRNFDSRVREASPPPTLPRFVK